MPSFDGLVCLDIGPLFFKLPDDFDGSFADALRLFADYHESVQPADRTKVPSDLSEAQQEERKKRWQLFLDAVAQGKRVAGQMSVSRVVHKKAEIQPLD